MSASIRDLAEKPTGAIPKNLQKVLLVGIGLLVLLSGFCSRPNQPPRGKDDVQNPLPVSGADVDRITQAQKDLNERLKLLDQPPYQSKESAKYLVPSQPNLGELPRERHNGLSTADGRDQSSSTVETEIQRRESTAPYAPIIVYKASSIREPMPGLVAVEQRPAESSLAEKSFPPASPETAKTSTLQGKESGKWEPPQEGNLFRVYEGTSIEGALVNRLDGTFTGPVICQVTTSVFSATQHAELIPKGARFLGETKSVELDGQRRLAVTFHRLLLDNGYSVDLENLKGLSETGETGLKDKVDNHYLQRFFTSGVIGLFAGLSLRGTQSGIATDAGDAYRQGVSSSLGNSATGILNKSMNILPTVTIREGHPMRVTLNRDLLLPEYRSERNER